MRFPRAGVRGDRRIRGKNVNGRIAGTLTSWHSTLAFHPTILSCLWLGN